MGGFSKYKKKKKELKKKKRSLALRKNKSVREIN